MISKRPVIFMVKDGVKSWGGGECRLSKYGLGVESWHRKKLRGQELALKYFFPKTFATDAASTCIRSLHHPYIFP